MCVRLILVLVWKTLILVLVWGTYYVPATYVPGISRQTTVWYQVRTYNIGLHPKKKKKTPGTVPACASLPIAGSALPPVGRATPLLWWARQSLVPHDRWRFSAGGREQLTVLSGTSTIGHGLHVADLLDDRWRLRAGGREQWTVLSGTSTIGRNCYIPTKK